MLPEKWNGFGFAYENSASCSFLVVRTEAQARTLEFQVTMLENNRMERVLQFEPKRSNGQTFIYYDITSRLQLAFFLKRWKLTRNEFIKLLADIAKTLLDSAGFLLDDSSFIIDADHIFINPETRELSLVYVPVDIGGDTSETMRDFVADLVLNHAVIDEAESDNFLQRILSFIKRDAFNIKEFFEFLNSLLYGGEERNGQVRANQADEQTEGEKESGGRRHGFKPGASGTVTNINAGPVLIALFLQFAMAAAVVFCMKYTVTSSADSGPTQAAIIIIAAALDVLLLKNLLYKKGIITKAAAESDSKRTIAKAAAESDNKGTKAKAAAELNNKGTITKATVESDEIHARPSGMATYNQEIPANGSGQYSQTHVESSSRESTAVRKETHPYKGSGKTEFLGTVRGSSPILLGRNASDPEIVIDKPDFVIGRLEGRVDHVCRNNAVGKVHAQFLSKDGSYFLKDLNSVNGTFINDVRIDSNKEFKVKENDIVRLANIEYVFSLR